MTTLFWLTNENADIAGYKRLKMEARSDCPSLVRAVGATSGAWLSDPLSGNDLTAAAWEFHIWGSASAAATLKFQIHRFSAAAGEDATAIDDPTGATLVAASRSSGRSVVATATVMAEGDRLALTVIPSGATVTVSYNGQRSRAEGDSYITSPNDLMLAAQIPEPTRTAIRQTIQDVAQQNPNLKDQSVDLSLRQALHDYTRDRPYIDIDSLSGDGVTRSFGMPRRWIHGFSSIKEIEYPVDDTVIKRRILEDDDWEIIEGMLGMQPTRSLRFGTVVPAAGQDNVRIKYTTRHVHNDEEDTIPGQDMDAVISLAAAYCCLQLAANAASITAPTIAADVTSGRDGAAQWQSVAKELRTKYTDRIVGGKDATVEPASVTRDWDIHPFIPGTEFLFKPSRWR